MHTHNLAAILTTWSATAADGCWRRFMPNFRVPRMQFGAATFSGTRSALLRCLAVLKRAGIDEIAGRPIANLAAVELRKMRAKDCKTWWTLAVSDCLCAFGDRFDGHPLLTEASEAERDEIARACDTTRVVDCQQGVLIGHPNNYWIVVLRCERNRLQLGLTDDRTVYDLALRGCRGVLDTDAVFMDDSEEGRGRYDVYAGHAVAATMELPDELGDLAARLAPPWEDLLRACAREDGNSIAWGRSGGHCPSLDLLARGSDMLAHGFVREPEALAGLCARAAQTIMEDWWNDDALRFHRDRHPHWYFGLGRILEMSLNAISTLGETAIALRSAPAIPCCDANEQLYPDQSRFIRFDDRGPGVWCFRRGNLRFQLPLVDGFTSDYVAAPVWPGCFEQISDRGSPCGAPVVEMDGKRWLPLRRPEHVVFEGDSLAWTTPCWTHMTDWDWWKGGEDRPGNRQVRIHVADGSIVGEEIWRFEEIPSAIGFWFAESTTPLEVTWVCDAPFQASTQVTDGMGDWQSHTHRITRLHQIEIEPRAEVRLRYRLRCANNTGS